jgi:hypothetical protein
MAMTNARKQTLAVVVSKRKGLACEELVRGRLSADPLVAVAGWSRRCFRKFFQLMIPVKIDKCHTRRSGRISRGAFSIRLA